MRVEFQPRVPPARQGFDGKRDVAAAGLPGDAMSLGGQIVVIDVVDLALVVTAGLSSIASRTAARMGSCASQRSSLRPAKSTEAFATGDGLQVTRIGCPADRRPQGGLNLGFDEAGHFSLAMEGETIVSGSAETKRAGRDGRHHPFSNAAGLGRGETGPC